MPYTRVNWVDEPSTATPTSAANFNVMDLGIDEAHNFVDAFFDNQSPDTTSGFGWFGNGSQFVARKALSTDIPNIEWDIVTGTTYTMVSADAGRGKRFTNAAAITVTWPAGLITASGAVFYFMEYAAGVVGNVGSGGATVNARGGTLHSAGQYATWQADRIGTTNEYVLSGDLVV